MREILFKAKRTDNGEWVEGNLVWSEDADKEYRAIIIPKTESNMFISSDEKDLGFETWYLVDPSTIRQYTGLTDKNGKKIWENDILSCKKRGAAFEQCKVVWDNHYADWRVEPLNFGVLVPIVYDEETPKIYARDYKKVGNVFDNPELLGGDSIGTN